MLPKHGITIKAFEYGIILQKMTKLQENQQQTLLTIAHNDYSKSLNSYAFFKVHDVTIGQDLVQDTFVKTWKFIVKGGQVHIMKAFLYHVLNRLIIDQYRKRKNTSLDMLIEKGFEPNVDSENMGDALDGKSAMLMINLLPEMYRKIMHMRYLQNLSLKDISLITGKTRNAIAVQTHRGLAKLKILYNSQSSLVTA
jgi:RNA polymerase sigma-70 factor (ECF subfamily)